MCSRPICGVQTRYSYLTHRALVRLGNKLFSLPFNILLPFLYLALFNHAGALAAMAKASQNQPTKEASEAALLVTGPKQHTTSRAGIWQQLLHFLLAVASFHNQMLPLVRFARILWLLHGYMIPQVHATGLQNVTGPDSGLSGKITGNVTSDTTPHAGHRIIDFGNIKYYKLNYSVQAGIMHRVGTLLEACNNALEHDESLVIDSRSYNASRFNALSAPSAVKLLKLKAYLEGFLRVYNHSLEVNETFDSGLRSNSTSHDSHERDVSGQVSGGL